MLHCPTCGKQYAEELLVCPLDNSILQADPTIAGDVSIDPLVGQTLDDKYRIEARLGVGGMGTVYRARHVLIDRAVAVKVLNPRYGEDEAARERFRREARAAGRLRHGNAVAVTDFGETSGGFVYIVMELLEGRTLREIIAKEAPLETARSVSIMLQASAAVAAAHETGVIHRDLKPANIFIVQRSDFPALVKVLDFGIAKLAVDSFEDEDVSPLTQIGAMIGTPRYMSPEQCNGFSLTTASDVYSLGVILYEMLTGSAPFTGSTPLAIAMKHAADAPRSPREIVAAIPEALERVILHALEKSPADRPPDAGVFRRELFETAERLGLEHAAIASAPDLKMLRDVATQSPSGRLVVDISRLRESRVLSSGANELTVIKEAEPRINDSERELPGARAAWVRQTFPRVSIEMPVKRRLANRKALLALVGVIAAVVVLGALLFAFRRTPTATPVQDVNANVSAAPTVQPSPSPSPAISPSPKREANKPKPENANANANKKKEGTSFFGKLKRIFKK